MTQRLGCLLIHGFGGTTEELEPLGQFLNAKKVVTLHVKLTGHTGRRRDLVGVKYQAWIDSAEAGWLELKSQCDQVVLIGFSMGGLIAANLALKHPVAAMATLNTPVYYWDLKRILLNILNDLKNRRLYHLKFYLHSAFKIPFSAMIQFILLLFKTKRLWPKIQCPIFIAQGLLDDTVQHRSADYIYGKVASKVKRLKFYANSHHLICYSPDHQQVFLNVWEFMKDC